MIAAAAALTLATALPARAQAPAEGRPTVAMDGKWHFTVAPYLWAYSGPRVWGAYSW